VAESVSQSPGLAVELGVCEGTVLILEGDCVGSSLSLLLKERGKVLCSIYKGHGDCERAPGGEVKVRQEKGKRKRKRKKEEAEVKRRLTAADQGSSWHCPASQSTESC
jgi:hypothetical protein